MTRRRLTVVYAVVIGGVATWLAVDRGPAMADLLAKARMWPLLGLVVASILPFLANTAFWALALRELGETITWRQVTEASTETTLTRYLPGGFWMAAGRGVALARRGVSPPTLVAMVGLEMALATPVALLIGSLFLAGSPIAKAWLGWLAIALLVGAATVGRPILNGILSWWAQRRHQAPPTALTAVGVARLAIALVVYWAIFGSVFWAYLEVMGHPLGWLTATGAFVMSWRIGLFAVVAPQGLGVFEPAFIGLVDWSADALLLVGAFRVVLLMRDLALTGFAALAARRQRA
ncbi:MAG: lysylphosphatidylglycerol synthase domain-containing protein [Actinomycetota bacterium]|nr:lysylphosphatidylglycerol synthase domain-containing protein [Actinomycetota bacterium]